MRPTEPEIPDKRYFKIGEVSVLTGMESYVLRYWETEFPQIDPKRSPKGQRLYQKSDIEAILEIKDLLYDKRFTIEGAKQYLKDQKKGVPSLPIVPHPISLEELREELMSIKDLLHK